LTYVKQPLPMRPQHEGCSIRKREVIMFKHILLATGGMMRAAKDQGVEVIVVGLHGRSGPMRMRLSSFASEVVPQHQRVLVVL
jgi:hypothetical protein